MWSSRTHQRLRAVLAAAIDGNANGARKINVQTSLLHLLGGEAAALTANANTGQHTRTRTWPYTHTYRRRKLYLRPPGRTIGRRSPASGRGAMRAARLSRASLRDCGPCV